MPKFLTAKNAQLTLSEDEVIALYWGLHKAIVSSPDSKHLQHWEDISATVGVQIAVTISDDGEHIAQNLA